MKDKKYKFPRKLKKAVKQSWVETYSTPPKVSENEVRITQDICYILHAPKTKWGRKVGVRYKRDVERSFKRMVSDVVSEYQRKVTKQEMDEFHNRLKIIIDYDNID